MAIETAPDELGGRPSWRAAAAQLPPLSDRWGDTRIDRAGARRILRCDEATLDLLCEHGLPSRADGLEQSFGECDVMNAGLASGAGRTVPEIALSRMLRFATGPRWDWLEQRAWTVRLSARCECGEDGGRWALPRPLPEPYGGVLESSATGPGEGGGIEARFEVRTRGRSGTVGERPVRDALARLRAGFERGELRFGYLPPRLRARPRDAVAAGVVDCVALTLYLAEELERQGVPAWSKRGHLLSAVAVEHAWLEIGEAPEQRVAVDPMLLVLGRSAPGVNPAFAEFCVGSVVNRLLAWNRDAVEPLVRHEQPRAGQPGASHRVRVAVSARARR